ncbi:polysaccharide deacetylase family protein [Microbulbifer magnicolonia]|uniref:polysaccharide deacetylase family protein n=1 Tax=Microbulbifer magnicolonia TaxID=3109744 RepID=UPI002B41298B|nr:polysaccharide deacetylase family protein [Microbulbifer sp. GG15]
MRYKIALILLLAASSIAHGKEVAFTFDDAPRRADGYFDGPTRAKALLAELDRHGIRQVAFFSVSRNLDPEGVQRLKAYGDAGHIIANHTHSHPDFNRLSLQEYTEDVGTADRLLRDFPTFKKWFRFPYLREGDTAAKRDGMRAYLRENGYINAYITLNNYDWYIETLFQEAVSEGIDVDLERLKSFYINTLIEGIEYYDQLALTHTGRSPKHVLLLHEMDITALFVGDLADALREKGWKIISPAEAYTDDIAGYQTQGVLKYNPGRVGEIARDRGQASDLWHRTLNETYLREQFATQVLGPKTAESVSSLGAEQN